MRESSVRKAIVGAAVTALLPVLGACGSASTKQSAARPPVVVNLTASITSREVLVSPTRVGAGPVRLVVTNQSDRSRELTLQSTGSGAGEADARSGPINPQGTAELNVNLSEGSYRVVGSDGVRGASLTVGRERPSGQTQVLEP